MLSDKYKVALYTKDPGLKKRVERLLAERDTFILYQVAENAWIKPETNLMLVDLLQPVIANEQRNRMNVPAMAIVPDNMPNKGELLEYEDFIPVSSLEEWLVFRVEYLLENGQKGKTVKTIEAGNAGAINDETLVVLEQMFRYAHVAMRFVDKDHRILLSNKFYAQLNSATVQDINSAYCYHFLNSGDCYTKRCPVYRMKLGYKWGKSELTQYIKGEKRHFIANSIPIRNPKGFFEGIVETFTDVTDDKRVELELRKFEIISEQNPVGILITDTKGLIDYVNAKVEEITGYTRDELKGQTPAKVKSGRHSKAFYQEFWQTIQQGNTWQGTFENLHKDGSYYMVRTTVAPLIDRHGNITNYIAMKEDITAQLEAEHKLKESERHYRLITDSIQDVIFTLDLGFAIDYVTPSIKKFLGYQPEEMRGISINSVLHQDSHREFKKTRKYLMTLLQNNSQVPDISAPVQMELKFVAKSGKVKWGETSFSYTRASDNKFVGIQALTRDVTEKKHVEWENQKNQANMNALLNNSQQAFALLDREKNILAFNNRAQEFTILISGEELKQGANMADYVPLAIMDNFKANFRQALDGEEIYVDNHFDLKEQTVWLSFSYTPVIDPYKRVTGVSLGVIDITKRKEFENKLKKSEQLFRIVADYTYHWEIFRNQDGELVYSSPGFEKITGYRNADYVRGRVSIKDFIHPEDFDFAYKGFKRALMGNTITNFEFRIIHKSGKVRHVAIDAHPVILPDGSYMGFRSSIRDISDKKRAEIGLRRSKEEFQSMFDNVPVGLYRTAPNGRILLANPALLHMLEYDSLKDLRSNYYNDNNVEKKRKDRKKFVRSISKSGVVNNYKSIWFTKSGERVYIEENAKAVYNDNEEILYFEGSAENITDRLASQKQERELNRMFRFLSLSAIDFIMKKDEHDIYEYVGQHLSRFIEGSVIWISFYDQKSRSLKTVDVFGLDHEPGERLKDANGRSMFRDEIKLGEEGYNLLLTGKLRFLARGNGKRIEKAVNPELLHKLQSYFPLGELYTIGLARFDELYAGIRIFTEKGKRITNVNFVETFIRQASIALQRKLLENQLKIEKERAERANQSKSEFLANMSHEIRTPMNAVLGFTDLLIKGDTNPTQKHYLKSIQSSGKTLLNLINDVLDMSKIEAGQMPINTEPVHLPSLLNEVESVFQLKVSQKNIDFYINRQDNLPENIKTDELRLRQVMLNLIGNAIKFTDAGGVGVKLFARNFRQRKQMLDLCIQVKDTGTGIPDSDQQAIFEAFKQQDSKSTRKYGGTGLGLAITKKLVEIMNGSIDLESVYGKGSTFTVTINNVEVAGKQYEKDNLPDERVDHFDFEPASVLVVDDVESNRNLLKGYIEEAGLSVLIAEGGKEGLMMAMEYLPDMILLDIRMPGMDGYAVLYELQQNKQTQDIPVIAVTASVMQHDEKHIQEAGFHGYIRKPINTENLLQQLKRFISFKPVAETKSEAKEKADISGPAVSEQEKQYLSGLIAALEKDFTEKHEHLKRTKSLNEIGNFAYQLTELTSQYPVQLVKNYGSKLYESAKRFDVMEIEQLLKKYNEMLETLKAYNEG